jgi:hypothetical protein
MEAARTSETSVDNYFTRQYIPEDKSELFFFALVVVLLTHEFFNSSVATSLNSTMAITRRISMKL